MNFILIIALFLLLLDYYIYTVLQTSNMLFFKKKSIRLLWWGYSLMLLLGVLVYVFLNIPLMLRSLILVAFFITFVTKFSYAMFLFIDDLRRGVIWTKRKVLRPAHTSETKNEEISRSAFLTKAGLLVAAVPFGGLVYGVTNGGYDYQVRKVPLFLPNLPRSFHGMKIGQISDIHSGSFFRKTAVKGGIEMLLAEKPDVIFFTGDLVNSLANEMTAYQDVFSKVKAPLGVFSSLGNHDYGDYYFGHEDSPAKRKNLADLKEVHRLMGWDLLLNEHRKLKVDREEIGILGSENWGKGRFPKHGNLTKTLAGTQDLPVKLLLSHDPSHWREQVLSHPDIDVMFAGHTHGMQFGVRAAHFQWSPVEYLYEEWAGLYREKQQQLYVNVGYGFLGYPGRVGIAPEITIFELIKGEQTV